MADGEKDIERDEALAAFYDMLNSSLRTFTADEVNITYRAFLLAYEAHKGTRRKSGEAYIMHPIAVAKIVSHEIGLGYKSIAAALLHDVVEDTDYTVDDIEGMFGEKIAFLVDGLTKFDSIFDKSVSIQAENFKKMMLAMADDIRVVLIKLADRLHNMRTLGSMAPHKQEKIASETLYLYAPLAHRLGLYNIKTEMEDLTMKFQFPRIYEELQNKIAATAEERDAYIKTFTDPIVQRLNEHNFQFDISGRVKSIYSIWKKMETKQVSFEEIYDLFAVRVVFRPTVDMDEKQQCWRIYSLVTDIYKPNYSRLRDWVNTPKDNGYESLHITVMGPAGRWVELQIRSERMNEVAERGYAAHWRYKSQHESRQSEVSPFDAALDKWLMRLREMLANSEENATEFLDQLKLNLFSSEIAVYTPKGKMIKLPKKSTAIDFAYEIHTAIGNKAIGAKVNHKLVPLSYVLSNGDQVEMLTADNQKPQAEWLSFAATSRARNQIKIALKAEVKEHFQKGKQAVEDAIRSFGVQPNAMLYKRITDAYSVTNKQELFSQVGAGILPLTEVEKVLRKQRRSKFIRYMELQLLGAGKRKKSPDGQSFLAVAPPPIDKRAFLLKEGTDPSKLAYRTASCCNPIPGDSVVGFIEAENKVLIHKKTCHIAIREASQYGDKIVNVKWTDHTVLHFLARVTISGIDRIGLLRDVVKIISDEMSVNIRHLNAESHDGLFEDEIDLYVHSTKDLNNLIGKLQKIEGVKEVKRI
ncbi:MAG: RelA/SpoT family protein [Prevotellaceae bacterium]|jgi:GTP pyrophosphokinase|nr:RelA/SpoT family protein [Prevotellaceae bacterium]